MSSENPTLENQGGLKKSLKLIYVYAIATGAIFTFVGYWDSIFYSYCGPATFLAFLLIVACVLPIAFVYCELSPMFPSCGGELIYNTVGFNKHVGFFSSWLIMGAWIAVIPAAIMAIIQWIAKVCGLTLTFEHVVVIGIVCLTIYCIFSLMDVQLAGKAQLAMLIGAIVGCVVTSFAIIFSGHWSFENFKPFFNTVLKTTWGVPGWLVGFGLLINPFFGFETVPQMIEEGDFPLKDTSKAIWGSVVTCGIVYSLFFFSLAGLDKFSVLLAGDSANGFLAINAMNKILGWHVWPVFFGIAAVLCAIGTCLLGFWLSTVRLMYAMGRKNFLPQAFAKLNRHQQPIVPNLFLLGVSILLLILQNATSFMRDFYNLMSFSVALAYALTMLSAIRIRNKHPDWVSPFHLKGGNFTRGLAFVLALVIAFFCCCGQGAGSWKCWGIFMGIGVVIWLWMALVRWRKSSVVLPTPDGDVEY